MATLNGPYLWWPDSAQYCWHLILPSSFMLVPWRWWTHPPATPISTCPQWWVEEDLGDERWMRIRDTPWRRCSTLGGYELLWLWVSLLRRNTSFLVLRTKHQPLCSHQYTMHWCSFSDSPADPPLETAGLDSCHLVRKHHSSSPGHTPDPKLTGYNVNKSVKRVVFII